MLKVKYLGTFPVTLPGEIAIDGMQTLAEAMKPLIKACRMPEDFFWENHLVLLNGRRPLLEDPIADGDLLHILSYVEGG